MDRVFPPSISNGGREHEAIDEQQLDCALEFCRQLQIENKQSKEQLAKAHEMYYKSDTYKNNAKFSVDMIK